MIGGLVLGLMGSVHCVGMCGPLVTTVVGKSGVKALTLYHLGRILVYSVLGLIFGFIGISLQFFHFQQLGSIVFGFTIIIIYAVPGWKVRLEGWYYRTGFYQQIKRNLLKRYPGSNKWLAAGLLNGFLPCGMVYVAAAGAVLSGGLWNSLVFMILFGLGTLPALLGFSLITSIPQIKRRLSKLLTPVAVISGMVLIGRGFLIQSPEINRLMQDYMMSFIRACGI